MNKTELVAALAAKASITKVDAEKFVNGFVATVEDVIPFLFPLSVSPMACNGGVLPKQSQYYQQCNG